MTTDLPSPAPDRAVEDVLSEAREALRRLTVAARVKNQSFAEDRRVEDAHAIVADALARLSDALSQPVAQPEGPVTIDGQRYEVEPDPLASWGDGSLWLRAHPARPLPGEPRQEGGG